MKEKMYVIKSFFAAVACFVKQTWLLGKNIFGKRVFPNVEYKDLAPIDDVSGCEEHIKALEWAVFSNRIKNIALSGPYGSGKSSIIVRDRIPQIIEASGKTCVTEVLSLEDYLKELDRKLSEELSEYQQSKSLEELADLLEVMGAVVKARGYTWDDLTRVRKEKRAARGAFDQRIYLKEVIE